MSLRPPRDSSGVFESYSSNVPFNGPPGARGPNGPPGNQGMKGPDGPDGDVIESAAGVVVVPYGGPQPWPVFTANEIGIPTDAQRYANNILVSNIQTNTGATIATAGNPHFTLPEGKWMITWSVSGYGTTPTSLTCRYHLVIDTILYFTSDPFSVQATIYTRDADFDVQHVDSVLGPAIIFNSTGTNRIYVGVSVQAGSMQNNFFGEPLVVAHQIE